ncbi:hypothetical protein M5D96_012094 [Drosophila gunungcola]|uniref:Uncharacterized protein n=1 Tax=Drosophila gunungcola TaxID=103775 RepID=A0A9Q0BKV1_9MUSC|nr:hypothetical protein M5D96_012094 [Drosophila gunungcola]
MEFPSFFIEFRSKLGFAKKKKTKKTPTQSGPTKANPRRHRHSHGHAHRQPLSPKNTPKCFMTGTSRAQT